MATEAQINANRQNALKSTGPLTEVGKAASSRNAMTHGLSAVRNVLIDGESFTEFETLQQSLEQDFDPSTTMEVVLLEKLARDVWRLMRVPAIEAALVEWMAFQECRKNDYRVSEEYLTQHPRTMYSKPTDGALKQRYVLGCQTSSGTAPFAS